MTLSTKTAHDEESAIDQAIGDQGWRRYRDLERQAGLATPYDAGGDERASQRWIYHYRQQALGRWVGQVSHSFKTHCHVGGVQWGVIQILNVLRH